MSMTLSAAEAKDLLQLCKAGRLLDVQDWIRSGKSLCVPSEFRTTPLKVALDTGFHSLVELLVRNEASQEIKNRALRKAVALKRLDFVELLVLNGAEIASVPFIDVLYAWDPKIIRYFLDRGTDFLTGYPFAVAFGEKIRTALGPWKECKQKYPHLAAQLQEQADRALRHFCFEGDLKWVSLLIWAGANPRSKGPTLHDDNEGDESEHLTALMAATYPEDLQILKRLKPDRNTDDLESLLLESARLGHVDAVRYLLELGAKPNGKENGGSAALDNCFESFGYGKFRNRDYLASFASRSKASKYDVSDRQSTVQVLLDYEALWRPDNVEQVALVRRGLYECEPEVTVELIERLTKNKSCSAETIQELLRTPTMQKYLVPFVKKLASMGFDVRTSAQRSEDVRHAEAFRLSSILDLAERYNREEIYKAIWAEPIQHVAKRYNISDVGLAKVCRRLNIPRPGRGYWAIKAAGKPVPKRPPLRKLTS
jgi:hypothetical protein